MSGLVKHLLLQRCVTKTVLVRFSPALSEKARRPLSVRVSAKKMN